MRRTIAASLLIALTGVSSHAISYAAFEQITVAGSSIGFTGSAITPSGSPQATFASCRLETAEVRYTIDGTTPTTAVGTLLEVGDVLSVNGHDVLAQFRSIRTGGTSGVLSCTYTAP